MRTKTIRLTAQCFCVSIVYNRAVLKSQKYVIFVTVTTIVPIPYQRLIAVLSYASGKVISDTDKENTQCKPNLSPLRSISIDLVWRI